MRLRLIFFLAGWLTTGLVAATLDDDVAAAKAHREAGRHEEARRIFARVVAAVPTHVEANYNLAGYLLDAGEWEPGIAAAKIAADAGPAEARYQFRLGEANGVAALKSNVFSRLGYARKCLACYRRAVELDPKSAQYRFRLIEFYQGVPSFAGGGMDKAYAEATAFKAVNPERGRAALANLYLADKKPALAFHEFDEALRADPDDYFSLLALGQLAGLTGQRIDEGIAALQRCLTLPPPAEKAQHGHAETHWRLGALWEKKREPKKARAAYLAALHERPDFAPAKTALEKLSADGS